MWRIESHFNTLVNSNRLIYFASPTRCLIVPRMCFPLSFAHTHGGFCSHTSKLCVAAQQEEHAHQGRHAAGGRKAFDSPISINSALFNWCWKSNLQWHQVLFWANFVWGISLEWKWRDSGGTVPEQRLAPELHLWPRSLKADLMWCTANIIPLHEKRRNCKRGCVSLMWSPSRLWVCGGGASFIFSSIYPTIKYLSAIHIYIFIHSFIHSLCLFTHSFIHLSIYSSVHQVSLIHKVSSI